MGNPWPPVFDVGALKRKISRPLKKPGSLYSLAPTRHRPRRQQQQQGERSADTNTNTNTSTMALPNPAINPPRIASPTKRRHHTRSPSRSPVRPQHFDPILRDLSPTSTLDAFARPHDSHNRYLARSIETANHAERALGTKAAQACLDLRSWARELELWDWPGTFDAPETTRTKLRVSATGVETWSTQSARYANASGSGGDVNDEDVEMWGSLPASTVRAYEARIAEIEQHLDEMDVQELKDYVLAAHSRAGTAPADVDDSIGAIGAVTDLQRLDDFTALITATILQTLPYISRLYKLMNTWNVRISICSSATAYLRELQQARVDLDRAWHSLIVANDPSQNRHGFRRESMDETKTVISRSILTLGRKLDCYLDELEGRPEVVPDSWIDDFESLEEQYGEWAVQAERKVLEDEWRAARSERTKKEASMLAVPELERSGSRHSGLSISHEDPDHDREAIVQPSSEPFGIAVPMGEAQAGTEDVQVDYDGRFGGFDLGGVGDDSRGRLRTITQPRPDTDNGSRAHSTSSIVKDSSHPESRRSRHQPIIVDYGQYSDPSTTQFAPGEEEASSTGFHTAARSNSTPAANVPSLKVKSRAAFLNGETEEPVALNRSKTAPAVRPFEHASNAFTRLFRKTASPERRSRSTSTHSKKKSLSNTQKAQSSRDLASQNTPLDLPRAQSEDRLQSHFDIAGRRSSEAPEAVERTNSFALQSAEQERARGLSITSLSRRSSRASRPTTPKTIPHQPETYRPTGMHFSPPQSQEHVQAVLDGQQADFPTNWPFSNAGSVLTSYDTGVRRIDAEGYESSGGDEIHQLPDSLGSDVFDRMFVETFPKSEELRPITPKRAKLGTRTVYEHASPPSAPGVEQWREGRRDGFRDYNAGVPERREDKSSVFGPRREEPTATFLPLSKPAPSTGHGRPSRDLAGSSLPRPISPVKEEDASSESDVASMVEVKEIGKASAITMQDSAVDDIATGSPEKSATINAGPSPSRTSHPANPMILKLNVPARLNEEARSASDPEIRRASVTSIGTFSHADLKSVDVQPSSPRRQRASSSASMGGRGGAITAGATSALPTSPGRVERLVNPLNYNGQRFPSPPPRTSSVPSSPIAQEGSPSVKRRENTAGVNATEEGSAPLNTTMTKRRSKQHRLSRQQSENEGAATMSKHAVAGGDDFDRHVSEVLDRVHAPIRFRTRPGAETPLGQRTLDSASSGKPTSLNSTTRPKHSKPVPRAAGSNITLAPAEVSPRKSRPGADEVKVYHLSTGKEEPIKLFVRLVGEGERVMVRVGGGWADLADYLRQYAEHHGSRTISTSLAAPTSDATTGGPHPAMRRTVSTPAGLLRTTDSPTSGTLGGAGVKQADSQRAASKEDSESRSWLDRPQPVFTMGDDDQAEDSLLEAGYDMEAGQATAALLDPETADQPSTSEEGKKTPDEQDLAAAGPVPAAATPTQPQSQYRSTPKSLRSTPRLDARPSTSDNKYSSSIPTSRPTSSRSFDPNTSTPTGSGATAGLGLAGPASAKRPDLPEQKARWVEDMLELAKRAGIEDKEKENQKETSGGNGSGNGNGGFSEMGRVGATRRLLFRTWSPSPTGSPNGGKSPGNGGTGKSTDGDNGLSSDDVGVGGIAAANEQKSAVESMAGVSEETGGWSANVD